MIRALFALCLVSSASALLFGSGGCGQQSCGCACPPPPPPCPPPPPPCLPAPCLPQLPPITLPALCLPPLPRLQLPCPPPPCGCGRKKRSTTGLVSKHFGDEDKSLCNNPQIRKIILTNISENPGASKIAIHSELKAKLHGNYVVMCSNGAFSFVADTNNYCVDGNESNTCYVFEA